jgi:hypothetical protein
MKKFAGFTPEQQFTLLTKQGYNGPADEASMAKFLAAAPAAAAKMGQYAQIAQQRLAGKPMNDGTPEMFLGGLFGGKARRRQAALEKKNLADAKTKSEEAQTQFQEAAGSMPEGSKELQTASVTDPTSIVTPTQVAQAQNVEGAEIATGTGQVGLMTPATVSTIADTATAEAPETVQTATFDAVQTGDTVGQALDEAKAAQGMVSEAGTVRGQLTSLMQDFEKDGTPPWASGAMRNAMSQMAARGLGASSMAGQAIVQAAMEAALPIAMQDAQTVAQFEMQNLNNEQQMTIFKTQQRIASLFSDQAAQNAALQFNAASENQTQQFFAQLQSSVAQFNAQQINAIRQFNAGEENAMEQFNTQQRNLRDQFNAQNSLIVAQANAQWRQNLELTNTAAQNEANMANARAANGFTQTALDQIWQRERDILAFAYASAESAEDRYFTLLTANQQASAQRAASKGAAFGKIFGTLAGSILGPVGSAIGGRIAGGIS